MEVGFGCGCTVYVKSRKEIWLIGSQFDEDSDQIMIFDIENQTFREFSARLEWGRFETRGALIPGNDNKILITGGALITPDSSVEIIDTENGTVTEVSPLNTERAGHGIGILEINGEEKLVVFGGSKESFMEIYNTQTRKWEIATNIRFSTDSSFGFLTVLK